MRWVILDAVAVKTVRVTLTNDANKYHVTNIEFFYSNLPYTHYIKLKSKSYTHNHLKTLHSTSKSYVCCPVASSLRYADW